MKINHHHKINPIFVIKSILPILSVYRINMDIDEITSSSRRSDLVFTRALIAYVLREKLQYTFSEIGFILGGRDHTTAIWAFNYSRNKARNWQYDNAIGALKHMNMSNLLNNKLSEYHKDMIKYHKEELKKLTIGS